MNSAHWHLVLNHVPVMAIYFGTAILATGIFFKINTVKYVGLALYIIASLAAIPVLLTGEGAEEILESIGQENEYFIEHHEEHARQAFWFTEALGMLTLVVCVGIRRAKKNSNRLMVLLFISGLAASYLMTITNNSGGEIRHSEIRKTNDVPEMNIEGDY